MPVQKIFAALLLGGLVALLGAVIALTPLGVTLEENFGLDTLFKIRGERAPPADVIVVAIDKPSTDAMGVPQQLDRWSRSHHAQLVDALVDSGAKVIAFDILFSEAREADADIEFAQALARAGNTALIANMARQKQSVMNEADQVIAGLAIEMWTPPIAVLADAAIGVAPFVLPKVPAQVRQYWSFKQFDEIVPALPAVAVQIYALDIYDDWMALLMQVDPDYAKQLPQSAGQLRSKRQLIDLMSRLYQDLSHDSVLVENLLLGLEYANFDSRTKQILNALIRMYSGSSNRYLNFYGGPRTVPTLPYHQLLNASEIREKSIDLSGKAVFVGLSEQLVQAQQDGFNTVFSQSDGRDLSGVEIGATAFANLLYDEAIDTLSPLAYLTLILGWGIALGLICHLRGTFFTLLVSVSIGFTYLIGVYYGFTTHNLWLPLIIPLFIQMPIAVFISIFSRYRESSRQRNSLHKAFSFYVPAEVVQRFVDDKHPANTESQRVMGTCMFTDAEQYTSLAEQYSPEKVALLMNDYYENLFAPIRQQEGIISDVVGDAVLALWFEGKESPSLLSSKACHAALAIVEQAQNTGEPTRGHLRTRIGIHHGPIAIGNVGAVDHFEYRAVGDTVNTTSRIEGLNKLLGTRILATEAVVSDVQGIAHRKLGRFVLMGKRQPMTIYEIMDEKKYTALTHRSQYLHDFDAAMNDFYEQRWGRAMPQFSALLRDMPEDGASLYYFRICEQFVRQAPADWHGAILLEQK